MGERGKIGGERGKRERGRRKILANVEKHLAVCGENPLTKLKSLKNHPASSLRSNPLAQPSRPNLKLQSTEWSMGHWATSPEL